MTAHHRALLRAAAAICEARGHPELAEQLLALIPALPPPTSEEDS